MIAAILFALAVVIVIVKRNTGVVALDKPTARGIVLRCGQRQAGIFRKRIHRLYQALSECGLADNEPAVVVLNGAGHNFRCGRSTTIHENHQWELLPAIAVRRHVAFLRGIPPMMRNDQLAFVEKFIRHSNPFT